MTRENSRFVFFRRDRINITENLRYVAFVTQIIKSPDHGEPVHLHCVLCELLRKWKEFISSSLSVPF